MRWDTLSKIICGLVGMVFFTAALAQSYDRYAYVKTAPLRPIGPTSTAECQRFSKEVKARLAAVEVAHDACLREGSGQTFGGLPVEPKDRCSNPACQKLHSARGVLMLEDSAGTSECMASVAVHQGKLEKVDLANRERRLRDAQSSPCVREWLQYEAICVGGSDTLEQQTTCSAELNRLRRSCPDSGR